MVRLLAVLLSLILFAGGTRADIDWTSKHKIIDVNVDATKPGSYPVIEEPWREMLMRKLQDKKGLARQKIEEARRKILAGEMKYRPKAIHLPVATENQTRRIELKLRTKQPIMKRNGEVIYPAGTLVEPLKAIKMKRWYLFATEEQVYQKIDDIIEYAVKNGSPLTILVTEGDVIGLAKAMNEDYRGLIKVYMATKGLVERMQIKETPTLVHQEGTNLVLQSIGPEQSAQNSLFN